MRKSYSKDELPQNVLMLGNPRAGKSFFLKMLMKNLCKEEGLEVPESNFFDFGCSVGGGRTSVLQMVQFGNYVLGEAPGLHEEEMMRKAGEEIYSLLRKSGYYQIFFVILLDTGRIRNQDLAMMKTILDAAHDVTHFSLIINQVQDAGYEKVTSSEPEEIYRAMVRVHNYTRRVADGIKFVPLKEDWKLDCEADEIKSLFLDVVPPLPDDLLRFILDAPGMTQLVSLVERPSSLARDPIGGPSSVVPVGNLQASMDDKDKGHTSESRKPATSPAAPVAPAPAVAPAAEELVISLDDNLSGHCKWAGHISSVSELGLDQNLEKLKNLNKLSMDFQDCHSLVDVSSLGNGIGQLQMLNHLSMNFRRCNSLEDVSSLGNGFGKLQMFV